MNRSIIIILTFVLIFSFSLNINAQEVEQNVTDSLSNSIFYSPDYNSIDINDYILRLPQEEMGLRDFGTEYQDRLKELADRYGSSQNNLLDIVFTDEEIKDVEPTEQINIQPANNININVGYEQNENNIEVENKTALEVNYNIDEKTSVIAGYEFQNLQEFDGGINNIDGDNMNEENNIDSRLGISYQTTDRIRIFADYVYNDILLEEAGESTVFGLEYNNNDSVIAAEYSIIEELNKQGRQTGLSYQYENLATFSASYKLLDPEKIEDQLKQEKSWDFGVNFNLNEDSSFSLGVQVKEFLNTTTEESTEDSENSSASNETTNETETDKETNVEASFQIKF